MHVSGQCHVIQLLIILACNLLHHFPHPFPFRIHGIIKLRILILSTLVTALLRCYQIHFSLFICVSEESAQTVYPKMRRVSIGRYKVQNVFQIANRKAQLFLDDDKDVVIIRSEVTVRDVHVV